MDFYRRDTFVRKDGTPIVKPDWIVGRSRDLMTRGGSFYAIWDEERGLWSTDIYDVQRLVDADLVGYAEERRQIEGIDYKAQCLGSNSTKLWDEFIRFVRNSGDNYHNLDEKLVFANTEVKKEDYASRRLPYSLSPGPCEGWQTLVGTLYNEDERAKIEWAIGAVVAGASKHIQKFLVFYGPPGSGKSTILNIIQHLFQGYSTVFDARELAGNNNSFATAAFKNNPLVAIQHDGDLSRIIDNTKLNSIVAHEIMSVNEKYARPFEARSNAFLFMGTNQPVRISDAKSGLLRRLIDVSPTNKTFDHDTYFYLMEQIEHELGPIAQHCLDRYSLMGKNYYSSYRPTDMMLQTDVFYNFVESCFDIFKEQDGVTLKQAWALYKEYCAETGIDKMLPQYKFREELKNYFFTFLERERVQGETVRSYFSGFKHLSASSPVATLPIKTEGVYKIELREGRSIFDEQSQGFLAQYANKHGVPYKPWATVTTTLADIDTTRLHFVKVPEQHVVIDFDLVDEEGNKSLERNLEAAAAWPPTYTELSKSGMGVHLHYIYAGDVKELSSMFDEGIEIKTLLGNSSLRRQLTLSNDMNVTQLAEGSLPKKDKPVITNKSIQTEKGLRDLVYRNLKKEFHPGTKSSVDFIHHILEEAYNDGMAYDLRDMRSDILTFAAKSTHQSDAALKTVLKMQFVGKSSMPEVEDKEKPLVFFDVEVYPNLFVVCWKAEGDGEVVKMINPTAEEIEPLLAMRLVGFNNRRYDNHILYARYIGHSIEDVYHLSQRIVNSTNDRNILFGEAYNLSYTDIYDFSSKKQSLKKFQLELGIYHMELDLPWDQPVPEDKWDLVVEYCVNDVISTEKTFESRKQDFVARQILAELSGLSVNHTTQAHTTKIIFGDDKNPQSSFVYSNLAEEFPGYHFDGKASTYMGEVTGEGGYVYAEPGAYDNVVLLDVASMHPTSIEVLNLFGGEYTAKFSELKEARLAIKHRKYDEARLLLNGRLAPYLQDDQDAEALSYALKIVINIVYGLTSARFPNAFRDMRNRDNIVAKRGALFMINLKLEIQAMGFTVAHIKTDSIKIPNATPDVIEFVMRYGEDFGYTFEHETTYDRFILVNDAVYIARSGGKWTAVGAQFQQPYVYKQLFTHEELEFSDYCEPKTVTQGRMYLDFSGTGEIKNMVHIGRSGSFVPVENNGGTLYRVKDDLKYHVAGTKGYSWITNELARERKKNDELRIDMSYFENLAQEAIMAIMAFDDGTHTFEEFI